MNPQKIADFLRTIFFPSKKFLAETAGANYEVASNGDPNSLRFFCASGLLVFLVSLLNAILVIFVVKFTFDGKELDFLPEALASLQPVFAIILGIIYGLIIYTVDRLILTTMNNTAARAAPTLAQATSNLSGTTPSNASLLSKIWRSFCDIDWKRWLGMLLTLAVRTAIAILVASQISLLVNIILNKNEIENSLRDK